MKNSPARPDPDVLLARVTRAAQQEARGRLKIFFGSSAGVGKTFAMLAAARLARDEGVPVRIGIVETHGRRETEAMAAELERLPLRDVPYRERVLQEFDLDAALAFGGAHPGALVLVDELAHSNAPGSRHPKRWQDIEELCAAGIDVWTTVNVQHLASLNDIVAGITGITVRETVPDHVFDRADEVVIVDLPPDELLARLRQGKVYLAQQAEVAARSFFRKGNLLALRELALRRAADRVDHQVEAYRQAVHDTATAPTREALLACIGEDGQCIKVVQACARLASQIGVGWHAVYVETPAGAGPASAQRATAALRLARELGAETTRLPAADVSSALVRYAREHRLTRLVMGRARDTPRWRRDLRTRIERLAEDLDVLQLAPSSGSTSDPAPPPAAAHALPWRGFAHALLICTLTTLVATPLRDALELTNIAMLFLLAVVAVALTAGRLPAVVAAVFGVASFDFFFVPPRLTFAVSDAQFIVTFAVMLVVGLVIGQLMAGIKAQAEAATAREWQVRGLYELARDLSAALLPEQVAEIARQFVRREFGADSTLHVLDMQDALRPMQGANFEADAAVVRWAFDHERPAGCGTDTLPASLCLVLPLRATLRSRGVLVVDMREQPPWDVERQQRCATCASLLAVALERIHFLEVAQLATVQMESERLRNSLLSAISHDLRTPLAALVGLAETLHLMPQDRREEQAQVVAAMREKAMRMNTLVGNLLDMARLESGTVRLNRQWLPLEEVIAGALAACGNALDGRPLEVRLPEDLPLLHVDAVLMERLFVNLLENAAKYTPAGSQVGISARVTPDEVVVSVEDHGPGLPAGREKAIFEKFERGSRENAAPGVGLGLAICRAIAAAHGGSISGESRREGGARFDVHLPRGTPPVDHGAETA